MESLLRIRFISALALCFAANAFSSVRLPSESDLYVVMDWDDTLFETSLEMSGVGNTDYLLFPVKVHTNPLIVPDEVLPDPLPISAQDWERLHRDGFAHSETQVRFGPKQKIQGGGKEWFVNPGQFYVKNPESYQYYLGDEGHNYILQDFKASEARLNNLRSKGDSKAVLFGLAFPFYRFFLKEPSVRSHLRRLTARGHLPSQWLELDLYLAGVPEKKIKSVLSKVSHLDFARAETFDEAVTLALSEEKLDPNQMPGRYVSAIPRSDSHHTHALGREKPYSFAGSDIRERKLNMLRDLIQSHLRRMPAETINRVNPAGDGFGNFIEVQFWEDNFNYWLAASQLFQEYAVKGLGAFKFVLVFTGSEDELNNRQINPDGIPRFAVATPRGNFRAAQPEELFGGLPITPGSEEAKLVAAMKKESTEVGASQQVCVLKILQKSIPPTLGGAPSQESKK